MIDWGCKIDRPALHHPFDRSMGAHGVAGEGDIDGLLRAEPDRLADLQTVAPHFGPRGFHSRQVKLDPAGGCDHDQDMVHGSEIPDGA